MAMVVDGADHWDANHNGAVPRARRGCGVHGEEHHEAAAAGGNAAADLARDGAERFSGLVAGVAAHEARGSGGGVRGVGWKRGLASPAPPPPPKRRAVSSTRPFPPVSGRELASTVVRSGGERGLRVGASTSHGRFGREEGVFLEKAVAAKGGASVADRYPHGPGNAVVRANGGIMRRRIKSTVGETVQPSIKANKMSQLVTLDRRFSSTSVTAMKKFRAAPSEPARINLPSTSALASREKRIFEPVFITKEELNGKRAFYLEEDDILMAVAVHGGNLELCRSARSRIRSVWSHGPLGGGGQNADRHRSRVRMICRRFHFLCRFLADAVRQGSMELERVDLAADNVIKKLPDYIKYGSSVGKVDGVEVGDEFLFRAELAIVGLHSPYRAGIDTTKDKDGKPIAVSIVVSGGYLDEYSSSGKLIYIGSGGQAAGTDQDGDQKLERGNLALKNSFERKLPVRVTHGFKTPNREEGSHAIGKEISKFIYDGLYHVVGYWQEGIPGSKVFKYKLRRIRGQPKLPLHVAKWLRKSVVRPR